MPLITRRRKEVLELQLALTGFVSTGAFCAVFDLTVLAAAAHGLSRRRRCASFELMQAFMFIVLIDIAPS